MAKSKITIVGLGLIGGSIGLALKSEERDFEIVGHDREPDVASEAKKRGAVDKTEWNLITAVEEADLIILAIPVMAIKDTMEAIAPHLSGDVVVTDTSTTKEQVMTWADEILPDSAHFVGGDPVVGKAQRGIEAASADLFEDAIYCLVPSPTADPEAVRLLSNLVTLIGAQPYFLDPAEHDGLIAGVSHLPFILATALLDATTDSPAWREMRKLASYDFESATHFHSEDFETYRDICLTNPEGIVRWIDAGIESLEHVRETVLEGDPDELDELFETVMTARRRWLHMERQLSPEEESALEDMDNIGLGSLLFGSRR